MSVSTSNAQQNLSWQQVTALFQNPDRRRTIWQLSSTLVLYAATWYLAYLSLGISFWLIIPFWLIGAGLLVRVFIFFHDCGHGSFFRSKKANDFWGIVTGILAFTPYYYWRASHAKHHATSADLDKRGHGDVWMMTVSEYAAAPFRQRLWYRFYRNPLVMFLLGPLLMMLITNRFVQRPSNRKERLSVYGTNLAHVIIMTIAALTIGLKTYLIIQLPMIILAAVGGVWLFYVQHQFDGVYWARNKDWDFVAACLEGGSWYKLPKVLAWFTGWIGFHHIHHLNSRIPNYHLERCHYRHPIFSTAKKITFFSAFKSMRYRLWDEEGSRLVGYERVKVHSDKS